MIQSVESYIGQFPKETRRRLTQLREAVRDVVPEAEEGIMYGLIGYKLKGKPLVYFGGFAAHIGFYATPQGHTAFANELSKYRQGKGSVQFPLSQALPLGLVKKMVRLRKEQVG